MNELNNFLLKIESYLGGSAWFTILLLGTGVFYTIYLKFPQIRYFRHAIRVVFGKYDKEGDTGDTSHFQALTTALSGTIGTGNIAGVAFAIYLGGPAALFWMLVTAFLGMTTKFVEVTLSHKYREKDEHGMISGGPMYYMKNKLNAKYLAIFFALMTVISSFGTGNMPQINSIASSMNTTFGFDKWIVGLVLAIILAFVILGGIKRIASVTEKLVPGMALIYLIGALAVIFNNYENIIPSFQAIFGNILSGTAATGGFLGASFSYAFNRGVNRGLFSNEAGQGSAPIAHAAARTEESVSEGLVSILEPFIDTIVICTITGLVILSSGVWKEKHSNTFQKADMVIMADVYNDSTEGDHEKLYNFVYEGLELETFSGNLEIIDGQIKNNLSIINSHSIAEDVKVYNNQDSLFTGILPVVKGNYHSDKDIYFKGKSLIHSAPLTAEAFSHSIFGKWGKWIVTIGLLLFAFSTSIAWAYYGGRSIMFLVGAKGILPYRIIYCIGFFVASFIDTSIVWTISGISIVLMAIPNLVGILLLSKDMKTTVSEYWQKFDKEHKR